MTYVYLVINVDMTGLVTNMSYCLSIDGEQTPVEEFDYRDKEDVILRCFMALQNQLASRYNRDHQIVIFDTESDLLDLWLSMARYKIYPWLKVSPKDTVLNLGKYLAHRTTTFTGLRKLFNLDSDLSDPETLAAVHKAYKPVLQRPTSYGSK